MRIEAAVAVADTTLYYDKLYSYAVPAPLEGHIFVGSMVMVPFGRGKTKPRAGVVVELAEVEAHTRKLRAILQACPKQDALPEELLSIADYLRQATLCTWFEAIRAVVPTGAQYRVVAEDDGWKLERRLRAKAARHYRVCGLTEGLKSKKQQEVVAFLGTDEKSKDEILTGCDVSEAVLANLVKKGVLAQRQVEMEPAGGVVEADFTPRTLFMEDAATPMALTVEQQQATDALKESMKQPEPRPALLYGVTGSGKTAVFLELVRHALQNGKNALVLVPEIGLTPQMIAQLKAAFGSGVAVLHSGLNDTQRLTQWQAIRGGAARVVVGTRSAVFAPLENIGLIVVDEEQEKTYQSEKSPRYDAVAVARRRAARQGALLLLSSATPRVTTYYQAMQGHTDLLRLARRYGNLPLPEVEMVDMNRELTAGNMGEISEALAGGIQRALDEKQQVILLLNRRGYHRVGQCRSCGAVLKCGECSVPMIYHRGAPLATGPDAERHRFEKPAAAAKGGGHKISWMGAGTGEAAPAPAPESAAGPHSGRPATGALEDGAPGESALFPPGGPRYDPRDVMMDAAATQLPPGGYLLCHYCGRREEEVPDKCPECGGPMRYSGIGTQRVEDELAAFFPSARIVRMDMDSTARKGSHTRMLREFGAGAYDILLGTQMVAKGLDFERVGLVGVIGIDSLLNSQNYLAFESAFSLITQVVGRAGRAAAGSRAMIQTFQPLHPVLLLAARQDYEAFYQQEIAFRKMSLYPPFCSLCVVGFMAPEEEDALLGARRFALLLAGEAREKPGIPLRVLGPAPMRVVMVAGQYRYRLTIKCRNDGVFRQLLNAVLERYQAEGWPKKTTMFFDFNGDA